MNAASRARNSARSSGISRWIVEIVVQDLMDRPGMVENDLAASFSWLAAPDFARFMGIPPRQAEIALSGALAFGDLTATLALGLDGRLHQALSPSLDLMFRVHLAQKRAAMAVFGA